MRPQLVETIRIQCSAPSVSDCNRRRKLQTFRVKLDQVTVRPRAGVVKAGSGPDTMFEASQNYCSSCVLSTPASMSLSPTISNGSETATKRRRIGGIDTSLMTEGSAQQQSQTSSHIPKRGARACTNCRRGKNRCEGEVAYPNS